MAWVLIYGMGLGCVEYEAHAHNHTQVAYSLLGFLNLNISQKLF